MPRYQPDPLLREGQRSRSWAWIMGGVVVVIIALTFIALNQNHQTTAQNQGPNAGANQPATTGAGPSSQPGSQPNSQPMPPSPGRGNADAPRETQGKSEGKTQR